MKALRKLERIFTAVTFAESGEFETAREILRDKEQKRIVSRKRPAMSAPSRMQ